jgi:DNA-binding response OmpR family regulator
MATVLVIENDPELREEIAKVLSGFWEPILVRKWQIGASYLRHEPIPLAVMALDPYTGFDVLRELRRLAPIVVYGPQQDRDEAMKAGAYHYLSTPLDLDQLVKTVRTAFRRFVHPTAPQQEALEFEELVVDPAAFDALVSGVSVGLTPSEFRLLHTLARHPDRFLPRDELIEEISGRETDRGRAVDAMVMRIRRKIESVRAEHVFIESEPGSGYRLKPISKTAVASSERAFRDEILPVIADLATSDLANSTGLSARYCHAVKRGEQVPHRRHWDAFRRAAEDRCDA